MVYVIIDYILKVKQGRVRMKRNNSIKKHLIVLGAVLFIGCGLSGQSYASNTTYPIAQLEASKDASQIILVVGKGNYDATVSYYKKKESEAIGPAVSAGGWEHKFSVEGVVGKNGITSEKKEGDSKTPEGVYQFTLAFGLFDNPGSQIPYHKIQMGDYWVDDSASVYYNKLVNVNSTPKSWNSAEDMMACVPYYNYGLALNYNEECVPGEGSAIFIHCTKSTADTGSAGCVRIPQEKMKQLVESVDEHTKIIIVDSIEDLEDY